MPDSASPVRNRKVGHPYHFYAVAASNRFTLGTVNAAVTRNSTNMGRGFCDLTEWRERAGAHVTTSLRLLVTRAAIERGKVRASFLSSWHPLAVGLSWRAGRQRLLLSFSLLVAACAADWCRAEHQPVPHSASRPFRYQSAHKRYQAGHKRYQSGQHAIIVPARAYASPSLLPPQEIRRSLRRPLGAVAHLCYCLGASGLRSASSCLQRLFACPTT